MRFLLVCEGPGDVDDLMTLTRRVLRAAHPWLEDHDVDTPPWPVWWTFDGRPFLAWRDIDALCDEHRVPRVQGLGMGVGRRAAARLLRCLTLPTVAPPTETLRVLLVHDEDGQTGWREGLCAVRDAWQQLRAQEGHPTDADAAVGVAAPEHEAWLLAAYDPRSEDARHTLEALRRELGFDPRTEGDRLTSGREEARKDAKRVLRALCSDETQRRALMAEVDLDLLRVRGGKTGLTRFLDELQTRVATVYGYVAPTAPP